MSVLLFTSVATWMKTPINKVQYDNERFLSFGSVSLAWIKLELFIDKLTPWRPKVDPVFRADPSEAYAVASVVEFVL